MYKGSIYCNNDSLNIFLVGSQPTDRSDPGSTLVCVTASFNTACCRGRDNNKTNATAGAVGEWYYPDGTTVPRGKNYRSFLCFRRYGYKNNLRLGIFNASVSDPQGIYCCKVPNLQNQGNDRAYINLNSGIDCYDVSFANIALNYYFCWCCCCCFVVIVIIIDIIIY